MNGLSIFNGLVNSAIRLKLAQANELTEDNAAAGDFKGNVNIASQLKGTPSFKAKNAALFGSGEVLV